MSISWNIPREKKHGNAIHVQKNMRDLSFPTIAPFAVLTVASNASNQHSHFIRIHVKNIDINMN
jgi:hypothetical protein